MAIITISHQYGSGGETVGREVAVRLGFELITPERVSEIISERYQLDYSLKGEISHTPRERESGKLFSRLISAVLADMALLNHLVILECGGQFIFRSFPNALHVRITAPREARARHVMQAESVSMEDALHKVEKQDRSHHRFLRSTFRCSSEIPEHYDLTINTASLGISQVTELVLAAARAKKVETYGMVSNETVERLKLRNQIRLQRTLTTLSLEHNPALNQFAHPSELFFSRLMDFYGIRWEYEPRTFPLRFNEEGNILEAFSPDFYLPDSDLYVELTTMKQSLVTRKNRKVRMLRERYPEIKIQLLYQKDLEDLIFKYTARKLVNPGEVS